MLYLKSFEYVFHGHVLPKRNRTCGVLAGKIRKLPQTIDISEVEFLAQYNQDALLKKTRFTETQIVVILKEAYAGMLVKDLCRKHGISDATYYNWKSKYDKYNNL